MCYPEVTDWITDPEPEPEPEPTWIEILQEYNEEQWEMYRELCLMIDENGGVLPITGYVQFLLEELVDGPYWGEIERKFVF